METSGDDGVLHVEVVGLPPGQRFEVVVREQAPKRLPGRLKGLIEVPPDFDDPIPGMEEYS